MENNKNKTVILSTVLVLLMSVLLSCFFSVLSDVSIEQFNTTLTEKLVKDLGAESEDSEDNEFSGELMFCSDSRAAKLNVISNHISLHQLSVVVPRVSIEIPELPPKNYAS